MFDASSRGPANFADISLVSCSFYRLNKFQILWNRRCCQISFQKKSVCKSFARFVSTVFSYHSRARLSRYSAFGHPELRYGCDSPKTNLFQPLPQVSVSDNEVIIKYEILSSDQWNFDETDFRMSIARSDWVVSMNDLFKMFRQSWVYDSHWIY